ncbi:MAG: DUF58 domain-containing protein [Candidatus Aminicenantes bacterium]|nr:DUF58 domain-containing protein [Candidatus Aminicenantes bacterium]
MQYTRVKPREPQEKLTGVYTYLDDLIRLQFQAQGFSFLPKQPISSLLSGRHASRLRGRGLNFEEIRRYLPGDDIRNMDWKVTARTQKAHTRVFTEERDRPVLLLVDQRLSMFFGSRKAMKSVTAAETAALGAWRVLDAGDRVGALVFSDSDITEIKPHRSHKRVMQILQAVPEKNHALRIDAGITSAPGMLNQVLKKAAYLSKHDYLITIISDLNGADSESERWVSHIARHNDLIVCLIYDELETQLPKGGRLVVSDGEFQLEVDTSSGKMQKDYSEIFDHKQQNTKEWLSKRGIPILPLNTSEGVAPQVRRILGYSPGARRN